MKKHSSFEEKNTTYQRTGKFIFNLYLSNSITIICDANISQSICPVIWGYSNGLPYRVVVRINQTSKDLTAHHLIRTELSGNSGNHNWGTISSHYPPQFWHSVARISSVACYHVLYPTIQGA